MAKNDFMSIQDFAPVKDKEVYVKIVAYENFKELFLCERAIFTSRGWELLDSKYKEFEVKEWAFLPERSK